MLRLSHRQAGGRQPFGSISSRGKAGSLVAKPLISLLAGRLDVGTDLVAIRFVVKRQDVSIRQAQRSQTIHPSHLLLINEIGVSKLRKPLEIVEN